VVVSSLSRGRGAGLVNTRLALLRPLEFLVLGILFFLLSCLLLHPRIRLVRKNEEEVVLQGLGRRLNWLL
jgi:hypothetical protein